MKTRIVPILMTLLCAAMAALQGARAATITVTNVNDSGPGSLRQALAMAMDGDTISFDSSLNGQKITLSSGQLNVDKDVTISGPGANNLAVDGNKQIRVFYVNPGKTVTISGLTVENGASDDGGGIYNYGGALTVSNCTISDNYRGGIYNWGATLMVSNCIINGNYGGGGGIYNFNTALTVTNCTISSNSGSGISSWAENGGATLTINNSTLTGNWADDGGGILNIAFNGSATLTVTNCTISGNTAGSGGGIFNVAGGGVGASSTVTISNSTLSGNSAAIDGGGIYNGGGYRQPVSLSIKNSTVSGNSATGIGGGICNNGQYGITELELGSTILNAGSFGENIFNSGFGTVTSLGYNVSTDNGGGYLTAAGDQINTDPLLGPLQDNGGPTFTHALLLGSPATDAGDPNFTAPPNYDQRGLGFDRIVNGRIDIGSFEIQGPTPTPKPSPTPRPRPTPHPRP